jgi:hypothetical protein
MLSPNVIRGVIAAAVQPARFFVAAPCAAEWQHVAEEEIAWELFRGRLLDRSQTTRRRQFEAWNVFWTDATGRSTEPVLAVLLDLPDGRLHVTRAIHCYAWEGYHAGNNVYLSREIRKWLRELVGTVELARCADPEALRHELADLLFQAVVGTSRLPLTSVEAPLPGFTFGQFMYLPPSEEMGPAVHSPRDLVGRALYPKLSWSEKARYLEFLLRATPVNDVDAIGALYARRWTEAGSSAAGLPTLLRAVFDEVALSPYTDFVDKTLGFVDGLVVGGQLSVEEQADFLGYLLRHLARHLTAYDLITFHHRGANYPDALLLDAVLKAYLGLIERDPSLFTTRDRRRALRQGWLLRRSSEGLLVPDAPTSPGENARVLPPPHQRVPEEQILDPSRRTRQLFADDPLTNHLGPHGQGILRESILDLRQAEEVRELGLALFLDRPLGVGKAPGEPDRTPLFSYVAFSRSIAERRLHLLERLTEGLVGAADWEAFCRVLADLPVEGVALGPTALGSRPGAVSLDDARKVADDVRFLHTTRRSVTDFLERFDFTTLAARFPLEWLTPRRAVLILREPSDGPAGVLAVYDDRWRKRVELAIDLSAGYEHDAGGEYPAAGLRVLHYWELAGEEGDVREKDVRAEGLVIRPRIGGAASELKAR